LQSNYVERGYSHPRTPMEATVTDIVPAEDIERIVGVERHPSIHFANAVSAEQRVYILHTAECLASTGDCRCST
jgi:hypothetical protein